VETFFPRKYAKIVLEKAFEKTWKRVNYPMRYSLTNFPKYFIPSVVQVHSMPIPSVVQVHSMPIPSVSHYFSYR
jgi:hypothetical protein